MRINIIFIVAKKYVHIIEEIRIKSDFRFTL
jgi:hypothetical protein